MDAFLKADWPKPDKIAYAARRGVKDDYCICQKAKEVLKRHGWA